MKSLFDKLHEPDGLGREPAGAAGVAVLLPVPLPALPEPAHGLAAVQHAVPDGDLPGEARLRRQRKERRRPGGQALQRVRQQAQTCCESIDCGGYGL